MARVLALIAGVVSVVGAEGCSLLILDDMDFSDNADNAKTIPTPTGTEEKETPKDETLPPPSSTPSPGDGGPSGEAGAPAGESCTTQTKSPTYAENVATGNGQRPIWTNVSNVSASDQQNTSVTLPSGEESARLHVRAFKFAIPPNARIRGVYVDVTKAPSNGVQDSALNLEIDPATRRPTNSTMPWLNARTVVRYGPGKPLWDYPLTPAKINADVFGFNIVVKASSGAATASVDAVSMTVDYCVPQ